MRGKEIKPKAKSEEQALSSLMALCARAERSSGDAKRLMSRWGVSSEQSNRVLQKLIEERFIDDERYAQLFTREKMNINGWGVRRVATELYRKGINRDIIERTLQEVDRGESQERLKEKLTRRLPQIKYKTEYELKTKLVRYAASLGYDYQTTQQVISDIINIEDREEWEEF